MDPSAIATHSIQLCMDSLLAPSSPEAGQEGAEQTGERGVVMGVKIGGVYGHVYIMFIQ